MRLANKSILEYVRARERKDKDFPYGKQTQYLARLQSLVTFLNEEAHPHIAVGASVHDTTPGQIYLNDHGPEHIKTVLARAADLVESPACTFKTYELYLLVIATHLHDIGNILGRAGHEQQVVALGERLRGMLAEDAAERRLIYAIAKAHGGKHPQRGKDTIGSLPSTETVLGQQVRPQALAALLRLADELADDSSRAARFASAIGAVPEPSRIYHAYSKSLHSVRVDHEGRAVNLTFELSEDDAMREYKVESGDPFLLDEIYRRTLKMRAEQVYCVRHLRPQIDLDGITVKITIYHSKSFETIREIGYRLTDSGYPSGLVSSDIFDHCPEELHTQGVRLTGARLCALIKEQLS